MSSILGATADWYLMRASGFIALILLTVTVCLGIANVARVTVGPWTRAVAALVHRNVSLLAVVFIAVHILTAISDRYVKVPALAILVPGRSGYAPVWVGFGAAALDLLIAVAITSLARAYIGRRTWRAVHWLAYLCWPVALVHAIGSGSGTGADTGKGWSTLIYVGVTLAFAVAVAARLRLPGRDAVTTLPATARPAPRYAPPLPVREPVGAATGGPAGPMVAPGVSSTSGSRRSR